MYKWTQHYIKGDSGKLEPPSRGASLHSVLYAPPDRLIAIWVDGSYEVEWYSSATTRVEAAEVAGTA